MGPPSRRTGLRSFGSAAFRCDKWDGDLLAADSSRVCSNRCKIATYEWMSSSTNAMGIEKDILQDKPVDLAVPVEVPLAKKLPLQIKQFDGGGCGWTQLLDEDFCTAAPGIGVVVHHLIHPLNRQQLRTQPGMGRLATTFAAHAFAVLRILLTRKGGQQNSGARLQGAWRSGASSG